MSTGTVANSSPRRKQLSDQLDRFDRILDGLSEALAAAVADAAREGTRLAVKEAIIEIATDPALRVLAHQATASGPAASPATHAKSPGLWARLTARAAQAAHAAGQTTCKAACRMACAVRGIVTRAVQSVRLLGQWSGLKRAAKIGIGTVTALAITAATAPRAVETTLAAVKGAVVATARRVGLWTHWVIGVFALRSAPIR
jgi:hypothetical protein